MNDDEQESVAALDLQPADLKAAITPEAADEPERRAAARKAMRTRVVVICPGAAPVECRSIDISASGMGIVSPVNFTSGSAGTMYFLLVVAGTAEKMTAAATFPYCMYSGQHGGFKTGAHFTRLEPKLAKALARFLVD